MKDYIYNREDKEIIEGLRQRVETLIGVIQEYAKKLNLEKEANGKQTDLS